MIDSIRFVLGEADGSPADIIEIEYLDGTEARSRYPSSLPEVQAWEDAGNTIAPYDAYYGVTDEQLRNNAYTLNAKQAQDAITIAEMNPSDGVNLTEQKKDKENKRRNNRAKRNAGMTNADDSMADYVDACFDVQDSADDTVENLARQELIDWVGVSYPAWVAPL